MNDESRLMISIWTAVSDFIANGDKQDAADALVESFVEQGHDVETLYDADGECPYIDRALASKAADAENDGFGEVDEEEGW